MKFKGWGYGGKLKDITVVMYPTLRECCEAFWKGDLPEGGYWVGHDGRRGFRVNFSRWLANPKKKAWGWAEYKTKTVHIWRDADCTLEELISVLAHEAAHVRRPRYKDKHYEEMKAAKTAMDACFAYRVAMELLG